MRVAGLIRSTDVSLLLSMAAERFSSVFVRPYCLTPRPEGLIRINAGMH
jgi:hypothetical protein